MVRVVPNFFFNFFALAASLLLGLNFLNHGDLTLVGFVAEVESTSVSTATGFTRLCGENKFFPLTGLGTFTLVGDLTETQTAAVIRRRVREKETIV